MNRYVFSFLGLFLGVALPAVALAQVSPASFSFSGRLTDSNDAPITSSNVIFTLQIFNPAETCLLYEETQALDLSTSGGHFALSVGAGTRTGNDPSLVFLNIFKNPSVLRPCYTSAARDQRKLRVIIASISGTAVNDTLSSLAIQSMPFALAADDANTVQNKTPSDFVNINSSSNLTQANVENIFGNYTILSNLINGSSTLYTKPAANGTLPLPSYAVDPSGMAEGQLWYDTTADTLKYRTGSGSIALNGATNLPAVGTAGTYTKVTTDAEGRVTAGSALLTETDIPTLLTANKVNGSAISGTIGGATILNTTGAITTTGTITGSALSVTAAHARAVQIHDNDINKITLQTVSDLTGDLTWTLPTTSGTSGQFLTTNGAGGVLSWTSPSSAGITDLTGEVTATGPGSSAATITAGAVGTTKLANDAVTFQKLQNISTSRLLGRTTATAGDVEELQVSSDLNLATGTLSLNTVPVNKGGTNSTATLNNNRIMISSGGAIVESPVLTNGQILIGSTGAAPQVASLTAGTNISIVPSAGGITINSTAGGGSVTNVSGTAPINVVNNTTTPSITISQATSSTNGYLSSGDWTTFNNKLSAVAGSTLPSGQIWLGNASNQATATTLVGAVTVDSSGNTAIANSAITTAKIAAAQVTYSKIQDMTSQRLLGRSTVGAGSAEELAVGAGLTITGAQLNLVDTTDDDSFAALPCGNGFLPYKSAGAWTCLEAVNTLTTNALIKRDGAGSFAANQGTLNSLRLNNAGSFVTLNTPIGANYALTLPNDDGTANQVLQTDGSGILTWVTPAGTGDFKADGTVNMTGNLRLNGQWLSNDGGNEGVRVDNSGNVGIGTAPTVKFEVAGSMKVGDGSEVCSAGLFTGAIRYNSGNLQFCNFSGWQTVGLAGAGVTVVSGTSPLNVVNNTTTPTISISQANTTTNGYLSSTDWNAFNSKLGAVTGAALANGQIWMGNVGGTAAQVSVTGDVTMSSSGVTTLATVPVTKGGTNSTTALVGNRLMASTGSAIVEAPALTNGQIFIGSTGSAPQAASLTAGTNINIVPSAGGITINSTAGNGTVTNVTGTAPINVVNNTTTPSITISQATTSTNGYLSSTDWNAFSSKLGAVAGSALPSAQIWVGNGSNSATAVGVTGDISLSSGGAATLAASSVTSAKIADGAVALADLANLASGSIIARGSAATGVPEAIAVSGGLSMTSSSLGIMSCAASQVLVHDGSNWGCVNAVTGLGANSIARRDASSQLSANGFRIINGGAITLTNSSGSTYTLSLPSGAGSNGQILANNGSGSLVWATDNVGGSGDFMANGSVAMTNQLIATTGSATTPAYTFSGDLGTGIYRPSSGQLGFASSGIDSLRIIGTSSATINNGLFRAGAGTANNPGHSFSNDLNSGMYSLSSGNIGFTTSGLNRMTIDGSGYIGIGMTNPSTTLDVIGPIRFAGDGTPCTTALWGAVQVDTNNMIKICDGGTFTWVSPVSPDVKANAGTNLLPTISFAGDPNTGLFSAAADVIGFTTNGTERMRVGATGFVGIGTTAPTALLHVERTPALATAAPGIILKAQSGTGAGATGGPVTMTAGDSTTAAAGTINITAGSASSTGTGGSVLIKAGTGNGGLNNGTITIGNTGGPFSAMGGCNVTVALSSTAWSSGVTCTGLPATFVALHCTSVTAAYNQIVNCVPNAAGSVKCAVSTGSIASGTVSCMWLVP